MRIARLPNGQVLEFEDGVTDDYVDAQVRAALGLPEPVDNEAITAGAAQQSAQILQNIAILLQQLVISLNQSNAQAKELSNNVKALSAAYTLPKEIIRDANNLPLGVRTVTNG